MNVKLIYVKNGKTFETKKGEEVESYNFALELDNGTQIVIKNVFKDDYKLLKLIAERRG